MDGASAAQRAGCQNVRQMPTIFGRTLLIGLRRHLILVAFAAALFNHAVKKRPSLLEDSLRRSVTLGMR